MTGRVTDGATLRQTRIMDLVQQIHGLGGMTTAEAQAYMMVKYGLKWETTASYLREMTMSQLIKEVGGKWVVKTLPKEIWG